MSETPEKPATTHGEQEGVLLPPGWKFETKPPKGEFKLQLTIFDPETRTKRTVCFDVDGYKFTEGGVLEFYERIPPVPHPLDHPLSFRTQLRFLCAFPPGIWCELTNLTPRPEQTTNKESK